MQVYVNEITGLGDACTSLLMSKRTWTREEEVAIRQACKDCSTPDGFLTVTVSEEMKNRIASLIKWGVDNGHTTLLRYIDISITVEGLHRGAQDDFDAHAARINNRIVRSSTRLATFSNGEKSEWYRDKILYPFEAFEAMGIEIPEALVKNGVNYVLTDFGYIREDLKDDKDAKRGLYPLGIPSNFVTKIQYPELCHIVQHRDMNSHANPELKLAIEGIRTQLLERFNPLGANLNKLKMQPPSTDAPIIATTGGN